MYILIASFFTITAKFKLHSYFDMKLSLSPYQKFITNLRQSNVEKMKDTYKSQNIDSVLTCETGC